MDATPEPQTQRRRTQSRVNLEEDVEESFNGDRGAMQQSGSEELAKKLVRLALACEYQRKPIRRQDITEKVLGTNSRAFKEVFQRAQHELELVFGMRLVELPVKERVTLQQRRAANKSETQSQSKTATSWILTSILPAEFHDPRILQPTSAPTPDIEAQYTAIYTILVSLIKLSGGQLPEAKMDRFLRRLGIDDQTPLPDCKKNEQLMKRLEKDGYIYRVKESSGTGEDDVYWLVGPRGKVEIGDDGVRGLALAVHGDLPDEENDELERKIARSLGLAEKPSRAKRGEGNERGMQQAGEEDEEEEAEEEG